MYGYNYGYMGFGDGLFHVFIWILAVWLIVAIIRRISGRHGRWCPDCHSHMHGHMHGDRAMELLKERYVKGEINKEEFEAKKKDLSA